MNLSVRSSVSLFYFYLRLLCYIFNYYIFDFLDDGYENLPTSEIMSTLPSFQKRLDAVKDEVEDQPDSNATVEKQLKDLQKDLAAMKKEIDDRNRKDQAIVMLAQALPRTRIFNKVASIYMYCLY